MEVNRVSGLVIGGCIEVHRELGPGLLESVYEEALCSELSSIGLRFHRQVAVPIIYKGRELGSDLRLDLFVEDCLIVELKAVAGILPVHKAQLLSYLRLKQVWAGLLVNFHVPVLKDGIVRMVN